MDPSILSALTQLGTAGVFIWYLITERRNERTRLDVLEAAYKATIAAKDAVILDLQEKRVEAYKELGPIISANTNVFAGATEVIRQLHELRARKAVP